MVNIPKEASSNGPLDTALAEVTIISVQDDLTKIRVDEIKDYIRYPDATYPKLNVGDEINVRVYSIASESGGGVETQAELISGTEPPSITPHPKPLEGKKYLASMSVCFTDYFGGLSCTCAEGYSCWAQLPRGPSAGIRGSKENPGTCYDNDIISQIV